MKCIVYTRRLTQINGTIHAATTEFIIVRCYSIMSGGFECSLSECAQHMGMGNVILNSAHICMREYSNFTTRDHMIFRPLRGNIHDLAMNILYAMTGDKSPYVLLKSLLDSLY